MANGSEINQQAVFEALNAAAESDGFELLRSSTFDTLKRADGLLSELIHYWRTGERPLDPPDEEPLLGAIAFFHANPDLIPASAPAFHRELLTRLGNLGVIPSSTLTIEDWRFLEEKVEHNEAVGRDGTIYGFQKYEQLDWHWLQTAANLIIGGLHWPTFGSTPYQPSNKSNLPNDVSIGIIGDWGTGFYDAGDNRRPAKKVIDNLVAKNVDYIIHLGDVYYSGTKASGDWVPLGEEQDNFLDCWPSKRQANTCFTLNSNHEMYGHAKGYFGNALKSPIFDHQCKTSYFLLENDDWQIFGLDSAWWSSVLTYFMDGALEHKSQDDQGQVGWIKQKHDPNKNLILMCHHNPLNLEGTKTLELWDQAVAALGGRQPDYWYWGHIHNAIVYKDLPNQVTTKARCVGHGAIPFGFAWGLVTQDSIAQVVPGAIPKSHENIGTVAHFAHEPVPGSDILVKNGFAVVTLSGATLSETFFDEDGKQTWPLA